MDFLFVATLAAVLAWSMKSRAERARIALLASHLRAFEIEKLMETLSEGYQRALGEADADRRQAIWALLAPTEARISAQIGQFAQQFAQVDAAHSRVMRPDWPTSALLRLLGRAFPQLLARHSFDLRPLLTLHAQAVARAVAATGHGPSARARTLLAELMLLQHSCHWFCKSRPIASARLLLRHQSAYPTVLDAVDAATRRDYLRITLG